MNHVAVRSQVRDLPNSRRHRDLDCQSDHRAHLGDGKDILHHASETHAEVVDNRQHQNQHRGQPLHAEFLERRNVADQWQVKSNRSQRCRRLRQRRQSRRVFGEDVRERGDGTGLNDSEQSPAVKKRDERSISPLEKNVLPARARHH